MDVGQECFLFTPSLGSALVLLHYFQPTPELGLKQKFMNMTRLWFCETRTNRNAPENSSYKLPVVVLLEGLDGLHL